MGFNNLSDKCCILKVLDSYHVLFLHSQYVEEDFVVTRKHLKKTKRD